MIDKQCSKILASLVSTSNRNAVLSMQDDTNKIRNIATQLLEDYQIFQRDDSCTFSMRLEYARILHNHRLLNDAIAIQQSVLRWRRQHREEEDSRLLIEALRSYALSLMALGSYSKSRDVLEEALNVCNASLKPESIHTLGCKEALAALRNSEGNTEEAIEISKEVLRTAQECADSSQSQIIGTMSDLAIYLALASRWKESWKTIGRAKDIAENSLRQQDIANLWVHLNASTLSGVMRLPVVERSGQVVAAERGGRVIATLRDKRVAEQLSANPTREYRGRGHDSYKQRLWNGVTNLVCR
jgi:tetratricopeptide (TPR) repeat protein